MPRLTAQLAFLLVLALAPAALAGDYHIGATLVCADCHTSHDSQQHALSPGAFTTALGAGGPQANLLRDDENRVCLACHDGTTFAPDVFGANGGAPAVRQAGSLNVAPGNAGGLVNDAGFTETGGHTLYSTAMPPHGATVPAYAPSAIGLRCIDCHSPHGSANYRNLLGSGLFAGDTLSYAIGANDLTRDVFERVAGGYRASDVAFNEPDPRGSRYAQWCNSCHADFHGRGGDAQMGGAAGGAGAENVSPWRQHPTADVHIGASGASGTWISSLAQYQSHTNRVPVLDAQGLWSATEGDNTLTPSCMSCHKAHGNRNAFGLIFMSGGGTVTDDGDGGTLSDLCRQCHTEGASSSGGGTAGVSGAPPPLRH